MILAMTTDTGKVSEIHICDLRYRDQLIVWRNYFQHGHMTNTDIAPCENAIVAVEVPQYQSS